MKYIIWSVDATGIVLRVVMKFITDASVLNTQMA
jgi:hypothetical protein